MNETWWVDQGQLDGAQLTVLAEPPETEMLVVGPPGSGKTNILMLRANYVRHVSPRTLFLTFTRTLCEFLRSSPNIGRTDQIQKDEIQTCMNWSKKLIRELGSDPIEEDDFSKLRQGISQQLNELLISEKVGKLIDVVFVDEVQDLTAIELDNIRRVSKRINAAGDSRQRIFDNRDGMPTISGYVQKIVPLDKHYRVGENICRFADQIYPPHEGEVSMLEGCNYPEEARPSIVETFSVHDKNEMYSACIDKIIEQVRYISDEPIGVLFTKNVLLDEFWEFLQLDGRLVGKSMRQRQHQYRPFNADNLVRAMTVYSAKGSEFRAVHMLMAEDYRSAQKELAFTAATRAKTELALYCCTPLPGWLSPARTELPSIASLF